MTAGALSAGAVRRGRLAEARLYLVTDARRRKGDLEVFLDAVLAAGVDIVQLREKDAEAGDLLRWARVFKAAADRHGALFVVNDRPDVAVAAKADGVHLGQNDMPPAMARGIVGPHLLIGLSTHAEAELTAAPDDADYVCVGPVHETPTKPGRAATGLGFVSFAAGHAAANPARPWFAIGGLDTELVPAVVEAGATRVVIVRAITEAPDPAAAVERLLAALNTTS
ncbi:MAG: thiamine phosphate synthase [Candidatus Dormibacteraeota bacterium]|nr:thiamine phosphate synthase [Candidatus Dormibacteraeota bacterium]MBV9526153.1 thiamine phosphate synthase [Candidatus Dormibacteraeota bacterium]